MSEKTTLSRDDSRLSNAASQRSKRVAAHRVLVVDDNRDARDSLALLLKTSGYSVETARDSGSALETAASFLPQVVILDIIMPGASGLKTAELMRLHPDLHDIIIISVTGWQHDVDDWLSKHSGCDYHLLKPLDIGKLETILQKHLPLS
jgi:two-component system, sensor histidine kinase